MRTRRVAAHRHPGGRHRRHHGPPPLRQLAPQPAQVPAQVAVRGERREHPLARPRRPDAGPVALRHHGGAHGRRRHEPAHAQRRRQQLARGAQVHDDVRAQRGEQRERGDVVAQLAVVVVLDDQEPLGPRPRHQRDPPRRRQPRAERELVRRRAVDGREAGRQGVDDQPVAVHRHREHGEPGAAQRRGGPLVARLLHGHPRPARAGCRASSATAAVVPPVASTAPGSAARPRCRSRCSTTALRNAGRPTASGTTSGGSSAAARQARRHAARSSAATQGIPARRSTGADRACATGRPPGRARRPGRGRGVGSVARPRARTRRGRHRHHEGPRAVPPRHPALGEQLVVGRRGHRPAHRRGRPRATGSTAAGPPPGPRPPAPPPAVRRRAGRRAATRPSRSSASSGRSTSGLSRIDAEWPSQDATSTAHAEQVTATRSYVPAPRPRAPVPHGAQHRPPRRRPRPHRPRRAVRRPRRRPGLPPRDRPRRRTGRAAHRLRPRAGDRATRSTCTGPPAPAPCARPRRAHRCA